MDPYAWTWSPEAFVALALAAGYLLALRRYPAPGWRIVCFLTAMVLLVVVSITPIHSLGMHYLLTVHLLQNVVPACSRYRRRAGTPTMRSGKRWRR